MRLVGWHLVVQTEHHKLQVYGILLTNGFQAVLSTGETSVEK